METDWQSPADLAEELGLRSDPTNTEALRGEIVQEMRHIHPDRNGGSFAKPTDESRYNRLCEARDYVDVATSTSLVPIRNAAVLASAVREALLATEAKKSSSEERAEFRDIARTQLRQQLFLPRISSGIFGAACGFLLAFGNTFKDNLILNKWLGSPDSFAVLLSLLCLSAIAFLTTWSLEQREARRIEWLTTEDGRRYIFRRFLSRRAPVDGEAPAVFSLSDVVDAICDPERASPLLRLNRLLLLRSQWTSVDRAAGESLAMSHLDELEDAQ